MSLNKKYVAKLTNEALDALILKSEGQIKEYADDSVIIEEYQSDLKQLRQEQQDRSSVTGVSQEDFEELVKRVQILEASNATLKGKVAKMQEAQ